MSFYSKGHSEGRYEKYDNKIQYWTKTVKKLHFLSAAPPKEWFSRKLWENIRKIKTIFPTPR